MLVMLPSDTSKLLAKWQGPFEVVRKLGPTTYEVANLGKRRSSRVLHVNLLKKWHERLPQVAGVCMIRQVEDEDEVEEQYLPRPVVTTVDLNHLSPLQQSQLQKICSLGVCQEKPGRTTLIHQNITLHEGAANRRKSYRIPERLLPALKEEVNQMLAMGIIEPSSSEWCSPVVLVPKKMELYAFVWTSGI